MSDKPFRVLLDLTDLNIKFLKYVWMNISPREVKTIADFKASVIQKINLKETDIKLFVRDGLLLDNETVIVLREDDTVKVQLEGQNHSCYSQDDKSVEKSKQVSRKRHRHESHSNVSKKCKTDSKILAEKVPCDEKRKQEVNESCSAHLENISDKSRIEVNNQNSLENQKKEKQSSKIQCEGQDSSCYNLGDKSVEKSKQPSRKGNHGSHSVVSTKDKKSEIESEILVQKFIEFIDGQIKKQKEYPSISFKNLDDQSTTVAANKHDSVKSDWEKKEKKSSPSKNTSDFNLHEKYESFASFCNQDNTTGKIESNVSKTDIKSNNCLKLDSAKDSLPVKECNYEQVSGLESKKLLNVSGGSSERSKEMGNSCPTTVAANKHDSVKSDVEKKEKQSLPSKNTSYFNSHEEYESFASLCNQDNATEKIESNVSKTYIKSNNCLKLDSAKDSLPVKECNFEQVSGLESKKLLNVSAGSSKRSEEMGNNCPKKKRKRHKKRKQVLETDVTDTCDSTPNIEFKYISSGQINKSAQRKHIIYSSSPCKSQKFANLNCDEGGEIKNPSTANISVVSEDMSNVTVELSNDHPKISTPAQSDYCETPSWHLSLMQETNLNPCYNENSKDNMNVKYVTEQNVSLCNPKQNENSAHLHYTGLPPLNSRPDIGTHIAYKTLELDKNYSPAISDYREGIVKSINFDNEEMEIELLKHYIKPGRTGKFENLKEDEIPLPEIIKCDFLKWPALVEPKIIHRTKCM